MTSFRERGNDFFRSKEYSNALESYQQALEQSPEDPILHGNISSTLLAINKNLVEEKQASKEEKSKEIEELILKNNREALKHAEISIRKDSNWFKVIRIFSPSPRRFFFSLRIFEFHRTQRVFTITQRRCSRMASWSKLENPFTNRFPFLNRIRF